MPSFAKSEYAEAIANAVSNSEFKVFYDNQVTKALLQMTPTTKSISRT